MMLQAILEPTELAAQVTLQNLHNLVQRAAVQQVELASETSIETTDRTSRETSGRTCPSAKLRVTVKGRLGNVRDAWHTLEARRRDKGYTDQSRIPDTRYERGRGVSGPGPQAFGRAIREVQFPERVRAPTNLAK